MLRLLIVLSFLCTRVFAGDIIELKELSLDMKHYSLGSKIPMVTDTGIPDRSPGLGVNLNIRMDVLSYIYWDNTVHTISDRSTYVLGDLGSHRQIGLEYRIGVRISKELSIGYFHYSQHNFDIVPATVRPHEDALEIRLTVFKNTKSSESILPW